jgi:hypothetical protein
MNLFLRGIMVNEEKKPAGTRISVQRQKNSMLLHGGGGRVKDG